MTSQIATVMPEITLAMTATRGTPTPPRGPAARRISTACRHSNTATTAPPSTPTAGAPPSCPPRRRRRRRQRRRALRPELRVRRARPRPGPLTRGPRRPRTPPRQWRAAGRWTSRSTISTRAPRQRTDLRPCCHGAARRSSAGGASPSPRTGRARTTATTLSASDDATPTLRLPMRRSRLRWRHPRAPRQTHRLTSRDSRVRHHLRISRCVFAYSCVWSQQLICKHLSSVCSAHCGRRTKSQEQLFHNYFQFTGVPPGLSRLRHSCPDGDIRFRVLNLPRTERRQHRGK